MHFMRAVVAQASHMSGEATAWVQSHCVQVGRSDASNDCIHYYETDDRFVGGPVMRMVSMALLNVICLR